jgi:hypothetical protein
MKKAANNEFLDGSGKNAGVGFMVIRHPHFQLAAKGD